MSEAWEERFATWAQPPGQTEQDKCDNAERATRKAIAASEMLTGKGVSVFLQGSYRNRTNVRADSDVDVCVLTKASCFFDLPDGLTAADVGLTTPASYQYAAYRNDVGSALVSFFGTDAITRGNKAFDIHENTYRIAADAVSCFEYRRYLANGSFISGAAFIPDDGGGRVVNWPQQNYDNGVAKNESTKRAFKGCVRILKRLRYDMTEAKVVSADSIPSFLVECLVWNVPDDQFQSQTWRGAMRNVLVYLHQQTKEDKSCSEWGEINELKYLFRPSQPWTRAGVNQFIVDAWNYAEFK